MSAYLTLTNITLTAPDDRVLCPDLTLAFGRERTGIVGQNGSGKSTLLDLMMRDTPGVSRSGTVGRLVQDWTDLHLRTIEALGIADAMDRLTRIEAGTGTGDDIERADWMLPTRLAEALDRIGLPADTAERRLADLSGGQVMRLGLVRLMLEAPDLILLDEPTNNLDDEGRALVRDLIAGWSGGVVFASHDRALLETMDRIVELTPKGAQLFGGGWSSFAEARAARREREAAALEEAERDLARTRRAIRAQAEKKARRDRHGRAIRARGGQPKMLLDAMEDRADRTSGRDARLAEKLEAQADRARALAADKIEVARDLRIDMAAGATHGVVLTVTDLTRRRGSFTLGPLDLTIVAGEHVALSGPNGSGKSTLIAALHGHGATKGRLALLDQNVSLLTPADTILANLKRAHPELTDNDAHATLARFAFRNTDAERQVRTLSGGERLRAGLAVILGGTEPPSLIILDEPTNHLDIEAVETLEDALATYPGALLIVSHDTALLDAIGIDRTLRLDAGQLAP
ncbi:ATP-binding cassette domain-containing protein [Maritimibacter dapengensis]|uniref:ATP-binding cassette domain-containing protein n=1 Tax=Maritimibacter dapengensis TaxID=2836868 RepID=A0ABS6T424_9RHOB|nr:ATP-binding cassette domain-containing protein [Maritimibacter dapengensis]MBV7379725.1 ATP-binding cassette domain-containing protein [Maritimibacter dapengensis]